MWFLNKFPVDFNTGPTENNSNRVNKDSKMTNIDEVNKILDSIQLEFSFEKDRSLGCPGITSEICII